MSVKLSDLPIGQVFRVPSTPGKRYIKVSNPVFIANGIIALDLSCMKPCLFDPEEYVKDLGQNVADFF